MDGATGKPLPFLDTAYERLHLVAVRFDLCDRHLPGACPADEDARMRLVFQPLDVPPGVGALDVGFHAFYAIRNDEIAGAVAALRELAMLAPPQTGALRVSPALGAANPAPYATKLRAFVRRYGGDTRLVRLTMNAQNLKFAAARLGPPRRREAGERVRRHDDRGRDRRSRSGSPSAASPGYDVMPITDTPAGLRTALTQFMFDGADTTKKRESLAALAAVENPLSHTAETVACVGCHVSTVVTSRARDRRARSPDAPRALHVEVRSLHGGRASRRRRRRRSARSGTSRQLPMISQRVVNDTAQTLTEIEQRFPAP